MKKSKVIIFIFTISFLIFFSACVNLEQKITLNEDGSGTIKLHYWTKNSNLSMGDEIGGFSFTEEKTREKYTTVNSDVKIVKLEKNDIDSTTHIKMEIEFKDINKLSEAPGFSKIKASWIKGKDGMDFKYIIEKDTLTSKIFGANEYKLEYKLDFPNEVISTNGNKDGNSVTWNKTIADLNNDIEMTAIVKTKNKVCGIFGYELPIMIALGMFLHKRRTR